MPTIITTKTKEQGSWSEYIEVGDYFTDKFGDKEFKRLGYAKSFPGLKVQRKWDGSGASTYCRWIIEVPDGFAHAIRQVTNPGGNDRGKKYQILYQPGGTK